MSSSPRSDTRAGALIESWIAARSPFERDRALLDAAQTWTGCVSVALWRFAASGWRPIYERGPSDALPRVELAEQVLSRHLSRDVLPLGTAVIHTSERGTALVFGGLASSAELEQIEALLWVRELIDAPDAHGDVEQPPYSPGAADP